MGEKVLSLRMRSGPSGLSRVFPVSFGGIAQYLEYLPVIL
jgi:hypothetical protein